MLCEVLNLRQNLSTTQFFSAFSQHFTCETMTDKSDSNRFDTVLLKDNTESNLGRRTVLRALGVGGVTGLAGCTGGNGNTATDTDAGGTESTESTDTPTDTEGAPSEPTGEVVLSQTYDPNTLDPARYTSITDMQIANNIYDSLVSFEFGTVDLRPGLATEWSLVNDGQSIEMTLREGVQFHKDWGEVTTSDVAAHFDRMSSDESPMNATLTQTGFQDIEVMDDYNFRLNFNQPASPVPYILAQQMGMIPSADAVDEKGDDFSFDPIGTGPYEFETFEPSTRTTLKAFDDYYRDSLPRAETVQYRPIPDTQTAWSAFQSQDIDVRRVNSAERLSSLEDEDYVRITQATGLITRFVGINCQVEPFTNKKVRQALNYATNCRSVVEQVFPGMSELAGSFMAPGVQYHSKPRDGPQYPYDPDQAQQLLEEAGYGDGFETTFWVPQIGRFTKPARVFERNWSEVGIDVDIQVKEVGSYLGRVLGGEHEIPLFSHSLGQDPIPDYFMADSFHSESIPPGGGNAWLYQNDQIDQWLEEATSTTDDDRRAELYANVEAQLAEDAPGVWIDHERFIFPVQDYVKGFVSDPQRRMEVEPAWVEQ